MKLLLSCALLLLPLTAAAQSTYEKAEVLSVTERGAVVEVLTGTDSGKELPVELQRTMELSVGDTVILNRLEQPSGNTNYYLQEQYRLPSLYLLTGIFFLMGVLLGGRVGFTSMLGLGVSIAILMLYVIPSIIKGGNPLLISVTGSAAIACTALYLAHGFNRRTSLALLSTVITLVLSTIMAVIFVKLAHLFGMGSEEARFIQTGLAESIDLQGLLLGGIIIGALGVLDDITTAQTAALDELSKANHKLGYKELFASGTSIGREHIASLINTLALAYVGASLPVFVLFFVNEDMPWWVIVNSEFVAEEVVRTLVGSASLLLAVPISTYIAAKSFANGNHTSVRGGHSHVH